MICENCGKETNVLAFDIFDKYGNDEYLTLPIYECPENAVYADLPLSWTGVDMSMEEQIDAIQCPYCQKFPFKLPEVQTYNIVRVVCFKNEE